VYTGEVKVLGNDATANINVLSSSSLDFLVKVTGLVNIKIDCKAQAYVLNGNAITLPGLSDPNNCIAEGLKSGNISIKTINYSATDDTCDVLVHKIVDIPVHLTH
jgi:hypothetical protein